MRGLPPALKIIKIKAARRFASSVRSKLPHSEYVTMMASIRFKGKRAKRIKGYCSGNPCCTVRQFKSPRFHLRENADPIAPILLALIAMLAVAKLGSELFVRLGQPAVLGELIGGVALGNLALLNQSWNFFAPLQATGVQEPWAIVIDGLAQLGVIILLFEVALESTVPEMLKVGASSFVVAVLGVIAPPRSELESAGCLSRSCRSRLRP